MRKLLSVSLLALSLTALDVASAAPATASGCGPFARFFGLCGGPPRGPIGVPGRPPTAPEPTAALLFGLGAGAVAWASRRSRTRR